MIVDLRVIQKMVDLAVGIPRFTYQMNRNADRPQGTYAAIRLSRTTNPGYDKKEYIEKDGKLFYKTTGVRLLDIDVLFSRDDVEADDFCNSFSRPDIREFLESNGYALMSGLPIYIKDRKFETDWEMRNGVTIQLSTVRTQTTEINTIKAVEINGKYNEGTYTTNIGPIKAGEVQE
ncbi:MAG: phage neck terminator protein [Anaerovoracaceae bacterium]